MMMLQDIKKQVNQLAKQIDAPLNFLPIFGTLKRDGTPHIEIGTEAYYYIAYDRNITSTNRQTLDIQELLYWIFQDITSQMGYSYELRHRNPKVESRRLAFRHQLELLEKLNLQWKEKREREIEEILHKHPYRDETT